MSFKKVESQVSFPKMEEEILKFWDEQKIFEQSVKKESSAGDFVFYEGPPTANGKPGLHHVLARAFKDIIPRYKTMKGYRVVRKAGWDTHGLPVELQVEKALGLKNKQDIENIVPGDARASIIQFNEECKKSVWEYRDLWEKLTKRMGYWVDMEHPYVTYENEYIESVWWQLAQIAELKNKKDESFLYKGHKVVPYCYRCGTALSSHEVAQGYQTVKDNSVYVKFRVKSGQKIGNFTTDENTYFLVWTTTPWTLPGNVALAVNRSIAYIRVIVDNYKNFILASDRKEDIFGESPFVISDTIKGESLKDLKYEFLYETAGKNKESSYKIVLGDFVTTTDGTGIVHIAPAFGEDDASVAKENALPTILTVDADGTLSKGFGLPGEGIPVKKKNDKNRYAVDDIIIQDLKERDLFFKEEVYEHEYPFCWRCETPLIYYAKPSWFIRMSELRDALVKNNEQIEWVPEHIKEGRFGEWLRGAKDWAISRERYWGTPLPIWECEKCDARKIISFLTELAKLSGKTLADVHRPYIDDVTFACDCGATMRRTPEVLDVWFDSGAMPLAQNNYSGDKKIKVQFPADYICEAIDQTRGWFYTLHAIATLLNQGGKVPTGNAFKHVICLGHILDAQGKKMSKSKGNIIDPTEMFDQFGADQLRWFFFSVNQPGLPKRFDVKGMRDVKNRVFRMLWNSYSFFTTYTSIDQWEPTLNNKNDEYSTAISKNYFDQWILAELHSLIYQVNLKLNQYDIYGSTVEIEKFIDNLSNWYIRRNRKRFWKNENDSDKNDAYTTLHQVLVILSKIMAPFTPFLSEEIYRNLTKNESVHLAEYPQDGIISSVDNGELLTILMRIARITVSIGLQQRAQNKIKVRQPLFDVRVHFPELEKIKAEYQELYSELIDLIKDELNVKNIIFDISLGDDIAAINTEITPELKLEGEAREIIRAIQEGRKKAKFNVEDRIALGYSGKEKVFEKFENEIAKEVLATSVQKGDFADAEYRETIELDGEQLSFSLKIT
ncbi:MAG TPA: isoleucine--tRNA ligase [Patescibacteria group bacterium]|nr:isoleucine--tRNA ligase [Patescibacteria group bacterium]